jgi:hypothetical protein
MARVALGFLLAPVLPALAAFALQPFAPQSFGMVVVFSLFSPLFAVPATVVLAVPLFLWFRRRNWLQLRHAVVGGMIVGCAVSLVFAVYAFSSAPNFYHWSDGKLFVQWRYFTEPLNYAAILVPYGVVMSALFWLIAYWKRPPNSTAHSDARATADTHEPPSPARAGGRGR